MSTELLKAYEPKEVERRIYDFWMQGGYFHAEPDPEKKPYTIVIPPPNITGQLHMGHALDAVSYTHLEEALVVSAEEIQPVSCLYGLIIPGAALYIREGEGRIVAALIFVGFPVFLRIGERNVAVLCRSSIGILFPMLGFLTEGDEPRLCLGTDQKKMCIRDRVWAPRTPSPATSLPCTATWKRTSPRSALPSALWTT